jgi:hypothetical protein
MELKRDKFEEKAAGCSKEGRLTPTRHVHGVVRPGNLPRSCVRTPSVFASATLSIANDVGARYSELERRIADFAT